MKAAWISLVLALAACGAHGPPPSPDKVVAVGGSIPPSALTSTTNTPVALADKLHEHKQSVVVFYRGYF